MAASDQLVDVIKLRTVRPPNRLPVRAGEECARFPSTECASRTITQAFDEAWAQISPTFGNHPKDIEKARLRLGHAVLSVATEESRDVAALKTAALQAMAVAYRDKPSRIGPTE